MEEKNNLEVHEMKSTINKIKNKKSDRVPGQWIVTHVGFCGDFVVIMFESARASFP